jgi:hypothetical protein
VARDRVRAARSRIEQKVLPFFSKSLSFSAGKK